MKKIFLIFSTIFLLISCSNTSQKQLNDIRARIKTNKGNINVYLYPEGAPITVLSFINLAKRGYYDNLNFHRVVEKTLIQGGDPAGDGTGGPGYFIDNEIALSWLNFYDSGMLAMANAGANTNGSQFFITLREINSLNGDYTVFGEIIDTKDAKIVSDIVQGDIIESIEIIGSTDWLYKEYKEKIEEWNKILDANKDFDVKNDSNKLEETKEKNEN